MGESVKRPNVTFLELIKGLNLNYSKLSFADHNEVKSYFRESHLNWGGNGIKKLTILKIKPTEEQNPSGP